jgi:hypothetical protein
MYGGGLYSMGNATISSSTFELNSASANGGAIGETALVTVTSSSRFSCSDWTTATPLTGPAPPSDRTFARAKGGVEGSGKNPTDRGRPGVKLHVLVDANGVPLSGGVTPANVADIKEGKSCASVASSRSLPNGTRSRAAVWAA